MASPGSDSPRGKQVLRFGKYKGWEMQSVLDADPNYARWALQTLASSTYKSQLDFVRYIRKHFVDDFDYTQDALLKDAWYLDPRAQVLTDHDLDPELKCFVYDAYADTDRSFIHCNVDAVSEKEYRSMLDQDLLKLYDDDCYIVCLSTGTFYLKPEVVNAAYSLREKFRKYQEADKLHITAGTPSKVVNQYWMSPRHLASISTGKWTLFFDKSKENEDGLTELDICYRLLRENSALIAGLTAFKVSTRRPNSNAANKQQGVAVIYCDEAGRVDVLLQLAALLSLKNRRYYWKYHTSRYSKDGIKASDFYYDLNVPSGSV